MLGSAIAPDRRRRPVRSREVRGQHLDAVVAVAPAPRAVDASGHDHLRDAGLAEQLATIASPIPLDAPVINADVNGYEGHAVQATRAVWRAGRVVTLESGAQAVPAWCRRGVEAGVRTANAAAASASSSVRSAASARSFAAIGAAAVDVGRRARRCR